MCRGKYGRPDGPVGRLVFIHGIQLKKEYTSSFDSESLIIGGGLAIMSTVNVAEERVQGEFGVQRRTHPVPAPYSIPPDTQIYANHGKLPWLAYICVSGGILSSTAIDRDASVRTTRGST